MAESKASSYQKLLKENVLKVAVLLIVLVLAGASIYFYAQYQSTKNLLQNPNQAATSEAQALVAQVGKLIELPANESPTIATVSDKTKLVDQPFFQNAQNGDKVLIYTQAKKAILYRPSINKIIEVAPINIGTSNLSPTPSVSATTPTPSVSELPKNLKVEIYNGTKVAGLAKTGQTKLTQKLSNLTVVGTGDAVNNYQTTVVIDLTGSNAQALSQFTSVVGGRTDTSVPAGEKAPSGADILIILGQDFAVNH